jgi:hypothetical protein
MCSCKRQCAVCGCSCHRYDPDYEYDLRYLIYRLRVSAEPTPVYLTPVSEEDLA